MRDEALAAYHKGLNFAEERHKLARGYLCVSAFAEIKVLNERRGWLEEAADSKADPLLQRQPAFLSF